MELFQALEEEEEVGEVAMTLQWERRQPLLLC
jgi:hypothetical protein